MIKGSEENRRVISGFDSSTVWFTLQGFQNIPKLISWNFLSSYVPSSDIDITEPTWRSFFGDIVSRFIGARHHEFLFNFLDTVSCVYLKDKRSQDFVFHLLKFRVPKLFAVDDEECDEGIRKEDIAIRERFQKFLSDYITSNGLKNTIVAQMSRIMVNLAVHYVNYEYKNFFLSLGFYI